MRSFLQKGALVALAALSAPLAASAQGVELGVDVGAAFTVSDPGFVTVTTPVDLRAGFPIGASSEIEPRLAFSYLKPEGSDGLTTIDATLGWLWHLSTDPGRSRIYLRPFAEFLRLSAGGESVSQFGLGGGLGVKLGSTKDLFWRMEAGFEHLFENEDDFIASSDAIFLLFGVSYQER
jgi:hypothetical protein